MFSGSTLTHCSRDRVEEERADPFAAARRVEVEHEDFEDARPCSGAVAISTINRPRLHCARRSQSIHRRLPVIPHASGAPSSPDGSWGHPDRATSLWYRTDRVMRQCAAMTPERQPSLRLLILAQQLRRS